MECGRHICQGAYANNVKSMYMIAADYIVDCTEFIWGIYPDVIVSDMYMD